MLTIYNHESDMRSRGLSTYLIQALMLLVVGIGMLVYNINNSLANFEYALASICIIYVVVVPIITMKSISEERKQHTDILLYSLPITAWDIVLGKFLAIASEIFMPLLITCVYPIVIRQYGDVYLPAAYGTIFAFFLLGASFIAVGIFISSLTENQGIAAGITAAFIALDYFIVSLTEYVSSTVLGSIIVLEIIVILLSLVLRSMTKNNIIALIFFGIVEVIMLIFFIANKTVYEGLVPSIMENISLYSRFYNFVNGVFDITSVVYYISVIGLFLFLTVQSLDKRRYN